MAMDLGYLTGCYAWKTEKVSTSAVQHSGKCYKLILITVPATSQYGMDKNNIYLHSGDSNAVLLLKSTLFVASGGLLATKEDCVSLELVLQNL